MRKTIIAIIAVVLAVATTTAGNVTVEKAKETVEKIRKQYAPDKRQIVYEVDVVEIPGNQLGVIGKISDEQAFDALSKALKEQDSSINNMVVLLPFDQWGQPRISVACLRVKPGHEQEMATQAIMGQPVRILEAADDWYRVQTPDGYIGWVTSGSIVPKTAEEMKAWRNSDRLIVTSPYQTRVWKDEKTTNVRQVVSDLVLGNIVEGKYNARKKRLEVTLPDGRKGWVDTADVKPIEEWAAQNFDADVILDTAYSMEGTPYLWGGTSVKTLDCSGLAKVSYLANGIILMRDASQQALTGTRIEATDWPTCEAGDLLFFGNADTGRVTHVAIYDNNGDYVHSSGRVRRNSVDPKSSSYLTTPFLHAVRIHGNEGTKGITYARNHPWYFD